MENRTKIYLLFILLIIISICEKKIYLIPEREDIVSALAKKVARDQTMALPGLADGKAWYANYSSSSLGKIFVSDTAQIDSTKFGRIITQITDTTYTFDIGWDSAYVDIKYYFKGYLKIIRNKVDYTDTTFYDTTGVSIDSTYNSTTGNWQYDTSYTVLTLSDTTDSAMITLDTLQKNFSHTTWQRALFLRHKNSNNPAKDWQLKAVTPMLITQQNSDVEINSITMTLTGQTDPITLTKQNYQTTFFVRDSLPLFTKNNAIELTVKIENLSPFGQYPGEILLVHLGRDINVNKQRWALADQDNDGIHTGHFTPAMFGENVFPLFIDLIDYGSLLTESDHYDSEIWMIPIRIPADL